MQFKRGDLVEIKKKSLVPTYYYTGNPGPYLFKIDKLDNWVSFQVGDVFVVLEDFDFDSSLHSRCRVLVNGEIKILYGFHFMSHSNFFEIKNKIPKNNF